MVYIQKHLSYPALAKDIGVDGMAVIQFVVDTDGSVTHVKIVRDIGAGCGEAAATVIRSMNDMAQKWIPGKQRGRPVKVLYTLQSSLSWIINTSSAHCDVFFNGLKFC